MSATPEEDAIRDAISQPKSMLVDGNRVEAKSISDQIMADEYLEKKANRDKVGMRRSRFKASGPQ